MSVVLDGRGLTCADVAAVAGGETAALAPEARTRMTSSAVAWQALGRADVLETKET